MKVLLTAASIGCFISVVSGDIPAPQLSVGITGGQHGTIAGLEPALRWTTSAAAGEFDLDGGITVRAKDSDLKPCYSLWGRIKRTLGSFDLSARADLADAKVNQLDLDFRAEGDPGSVQVLAKAGSTNAVAKIQVKKSFEIQGGTVQVNPRYDLEKSFGDVTLGYSWNDLSVTVDASKDNQKFTLARMFGKKTKVAPSVTAKGDVSLQVQQKLNDSGRLTATVTPKDSINLKWEDGPWVANIKAPMEGYLMEGGVDVSVKRKVDVF